MPIEHRAEAHELAVDGAPSAGDRSMSGLLLTLAGAGILVSLAIVSALLQV